MGRPRTHLVCSESEFSRAVRDAYGPDARLHPSNRTTGCGRHLGELPATTDPARVTCETCRRHVDRVAREAGLM